ncbi:S-adenosyl-L-methionine-dependent methyltransferase [Macrolepiota fuliginosa MF-IS2]|uniref:S-adenosyl-L-methionine-dependent methyltransferase n=1 Tax=Macrolepiota fuliginosa MF-IS2 TaxID=1400762 RepID=A0A9P6BYG5_9AGAR|nr:S-adenosyl-L-methionine-dependent methyltransferase [Macrolepiota fuliginosa MF-IS2]
MAPVEVLSPPGIPESNKDQRYFISSESSTASAYLLPADDEERERLDLQSRMINQNFDNKLIWAPITLNSGDIVLDSGTGSGHWLLSLAKEVPQTIQLYGVDLSPRMFPPAASTPPNATFTPTSITSLPEHWTNTLSLIHQRLLVVALSSSQWQTALSEMFRTLVPGGWVQLFELHSVLASPSEALRKHKVFAIRDKLCYEVRHVVMDIVDHLPGWLEQAGFVNLRIEKRGLPLGSWGGEYGTLGLEANASNFFRAIKAPVMAEGGLGLVESEEEYDATVKDFMRLCNEIPETYLEYWAFIAQKPVA